MSNICFCEHCGVILAEKAVVCYKCNFPVSERKADLNMERLSRPDVVEARAACAHALDTYDGQKLEKVRDMFSQKEELKNYLDSDEQFVFAMTPAPRTSHNLLQDKKEHLSYGYLVATTKRVIVLDKPMFGKIKTLSLPYSEILNIEKGHHGVGGRERMTGVTFHNFMKFTATDGRYIIADELERAKYFAEFYNYVKSMIIP